MYNVKGGFETGLYHWLPTQSTIVKIQSHALSQSMQNGRFMNVSENYFNQLFQHNNMIPNEQTHLN
jgi:hypothetical protein